VRRFIGVNAEKKYMFSLEDRKRFIEIQKTNQTITYEGLTIDLCHRIKADFILRGLPIRRF
jgi:pantetheine-phosphate adenylyltransferase